MCHNQHKHGVRLLDQGFKAVLFHLLILYFSLALRSLWRRKMLLYQGEQCKKSNRYTYMAVSIKKLEGEEIPTEYRELGVTAVFRVTDEEGVEYFCVDDVEAARLTVELSEKNR